MKCPYCNIDRDRVIDSRAIEGADVIRRRRLCIVCHRRFTTYERLEELPLTVVKSDNSRESFSREKLCQGIMLACEKRPVPIQTIERIVTDIEYELRDYLMEIPSSLIGEKVLAKLSQIDEVAYIRFASVYYKYNSIDAFAEELEKLKRQAKPGKETVAIK